MSLKIPTTYKEWSDILEQFATGENDQDVVERMKTGSLSWQSGVAERFITKFSTVINLRLDQATKTFQKRMTQANGAESIIVQALLQLRKEMILLEDAVSINALPADMRKTFVKLIQDQRTSIQDTLIDSAKSERSGKLMSIIRNNKLK